MMPESMHHRFHAYLTYVPEAFCFESWEGELLDSKDKHRAFMVRALRLPRS